MSDTTIAVIGDKHLVFKGDRVTTAEYLGKLNIEPTDLLPAELAPPMSDLLVKAMECVGRYGNNLQAFCGSLSLDEVLMSHTEADLYEVFDAAVQLYEAAFPDESKLTNEQLVRKIDRETGGNASLITLIRELRNRRVDLSMQQCKKIVETNIPRLAPC